MKPSKPSHKPHKSSRSSPLRKEHLMKKAGRSRSPLRMPGSSRSMLSSPPMKRSHAVPVRKGSHSPRLRSIASSPHRSITRRSNQGSPIPMDRYHLSNYGQNLQNNDLNTTSYKVMNYTYQFCSLLNDDLLISSSS